MLARGGYATGKPCRATESSASKFNQILWTLVVTSDSEMCLLTHHTSAPWLKVIKKLLIISEGKTPFLLITFYYDIIEHFVSWPIMCPKSRRFHHHIVPSKLHNCYISVVQREGLDIPIKMSWSKQLSSFIVLRRHCEAIDDFGPQHTLKEKKKQIRHWWMDQSLLSPAKKIHQKWVVSGEFVDSAPDSKNIPTWSPLLMCDRQSMATPPFSLTLPECCWLVIPLGCDLAFVIPLTFKCNWILSLLHETPSNWKR